MEFEQDWAFLRAALPDLQDYILSNELYWPLRLTAHTPGSLQTPQLTIGNLLLSQARLSALSLSPQSASSPLLTPVQTGELEQIAQHIHQGREEWRSNWSRKAGREFTSRLNLWQQYVRELRGDPRRRASGYASEVRQRAVLRLLQAEILEGVPRNEAEQLSAADQVLSGVTRPGAFVWEPEVEPSFPEEGFWFLYRAFDQ